jgi:hypothetical protein
MSEQTGPTEPTQATQPTDPMEPATPVDAPAPEPATPVDAPAPEAAPEAPAVEAAPEAPAVEAAPEAPAVEAAPEAPAVEAAPEAPAVEAAPEAPAVEAAPEAPAVEAAPEAPAVEAAPEAPAVESAPEAPPAPTTEATDAAAGAAASEAPTPSTPAGPRPSPAVLAAMARPAAPSTPPPAAAPAEPAPEPATPSESERFGRVDTDGTVHVTLADGGEAPVGQWAAGTPAEGLAFFARKYDDLSVEVDLATRRLGEGKSSPEQAATVVKRARESLGSPSMVGDLASLTSRVDALDALVAERKAAVAAERAAARAAALAAREAIVAEAETLAESTQWKATGERFKELLEQWKAAPRADRAGEQALWKRFSHARSQFDKHRRQYFARLDHERAEATQVKEALVAEAEALSGSTDWGATAGAYRDLMTRWKAAGRAGKAEEEALWQRFRAAQDAFFGARNAAFGQRDAGFAENLAAKEALLAEAEAIDLSDLGSAKSALRGIQERWEKIGHVPRGDKDRVEGRLRKIEDAVRRGEQDQWRRTNPEAKARASSTVTQFQGSLDKLRADLEKATAAGDARKVADLESRIATTEALLDAAQRAADEFSG